MPYSKKQINHRRFTISLSIFLLPCVFFVGFYFYYVPSNKEALHGYAFSILENISNNMRNRYRENFTIFRNYINSDYKNRTKLESDLAGNAQATLTGPGYKPDTTNCNFLTTNSSNNADTIKNPTEGAPSLCFIYHLDSYTILAPVKKMVPPLIAAHKNEFFESFLLLHICDNKCMSIYKDQSLKIGSVAIKSDSFFSTTNGVLLPGIKEMQIKDMKYKMFFTPFSMGGHDIVLCGFVKSQTYATSAYQLPVSFIYTIVILLILMLIALPLIKPFLIGSQEPLRFHDLIGMVICIFLGCTFLTITIIQVVLLKDGDILAMRNLETLSNQINKGFLYDLQKSLRQLDSIDSYMSKNNFPKEDGTLNASDTLKAYLKKQTDPTLINYNFDMLAWINKKGVQNMKAALDTSIPFFQSVNDRDYYTFFSTDKYYSLPEISDSQFTLQPLYNRKNGDFRFVLCIRSRIQTTYIVSSSLQLYSVMNVVLPAGYGFCIIDEEGNVMVHSAQNRNLNENLLNQPGLAKPLKGAIVSRQSTNFSKIQLYGKNNAMRIESIDNLPFFLVTFYDKGYIVPVNLRILIFSLSFCLISYFILCIVWLLLFWRQYYANALFYAPIHIVSWVIPHYKFKTWYKRGTLFLTIYSILLLLLTFVARFTDLKSNYLILIVIFLTPINILCGLLVIFYAGYKNSLNPTGRIIKKSNRAAAGLISLLVVSLVTVGYTSSLSYPVGPQLLLFQAIIIISLAFLYFKTPPWVKTTETFAWQPTVHLSANPNYLLWQSIDAFLKRIMQVKNNVYLVWYSLFGTVLIICLAVLPAALFTWYSHNQEILQSVKKQQLFLADTLVKRKNTVCANIKQYDSVPAGFADTLQYRRGIYTIYKDEINLVTQRESDAACTKNFGEFYFDVANEIGSSYYDPNSFPALKDKSSDNTWHWSSPEKNKLSFYYKIPPGIANSEKKNYLNITSVLPPHYIIIGPNTKGVLLTILCVMLTIGLYKLIRNMSERLFLRNLFTGSAKNNNAGLDKLINDYKSVSSSNEAMYASLKYLKNEYNSVLPESNNNPIHNEQLILDNVEKYRGFYDFIWRNCSDSEKYLLYHFARHGLMNTKNTIEIYSLIKKGVLVINEENEQIQLLCISFRAYILHYLAADEINQMENKWKDDSRWYSFRMPLQIILLAAASFIFFTQQEIWQRIIVLITGISSSLPLLLNIIASGAKTVKKQE